MAGVPLRDDFDGGAVRALAKTAKDGPQVRRLLALAAIHEGATRSAAARIGGVTLQIVRDPVLRFNASGPVGLINRKARRGAGSGRRGFLTTGTAGHWRRGSSRGRHRNFTVWCDGGRSISASGFSPNSRSRSPGRP